ncbi:hypothetical protein [Nocardiopsis alba]|uniref:hypothetical protein n=1 Tax=Nocardiopsis alba TaxID=53437 RepID=UPI003D736236
MDREVAPELFAGVRYDGPGEGEHGGGASVLARDVQRGAERVRVPHDGRVGERARQPTVDGVDELRPDPGVGVVAAEQVPGLGDGPEPLLGDDDPKMFDVGLGDQCQGAVAGVGSSDRLPGEGEHLLVGPRPLGAQHLESGLARCPVLGVQGQDPLPEPVLFLSGEAHAQGVPLELFQGGRGQAHAGRVQEGVRGRGERLMETPEPFLADVLGPGAGPNVPGGLEPRGARPQEQFGVGVVHPGLQRGRERDGLFREHVQTQGARSGIGGVEEGQAGGDVTGAKEGEGRDEDGVVPGGAPGDAVLPCEAFFPEGEELTENHVPILVPAEEDEHDLWAQNGNGSRGTDRVRAASHRTEPDRLPRVLP